MAEHPNVALLAELRRRQRAMYAGEAPPRHVAELLSDDVVWHVPGTSPIAGDHAGVEAVLRYFDTRRALAANTLRITPRQSIADDEVVVELADGEATLGGEPARWRTTGVYRVAGGRIAEAWLVPLDLAAFDAAWGRAG
jgi:ketosteroid isomerase-like protein